MEDEVAELGAQSENLVQEEQKSEPVAEKQEVKTVVVESEPEEPLSLEDQLKRLNERFEKVEKESNGYKESLDREIKRKRKKNVQILEKETEIQRLKRDLVEVVEKSKVKVSKENFGDDDESFQDALLDKRESKREAKKIEERLGRLEREKAYDTSLLGVIDTLPEDYNQVMQKAREENLQVGEAVIQTLANLDPKSKHQLEYYFATHPEEAARTVNMPPVVQQTLVGNLYLSLGKETSASKETKTATPQVAPTPKVSTGSTVINKDPKSMSESEFDAWYFENITKKR